MAKFKGKGVVIAGLVAGAASYLSKKENRDKVQAYLNTAKEKVNESGGMQGLIRNAQNKMANNNTAEFPKDLDTNISKSASVGKEDYKEETMEEIAKTAGAVADTTLEGNQMVEEGAQTTTDYYNYEQEKHP